MHHVVEHPEALSERASEWIADAIRRVAAEQGRCTLALAGGATPVAAYRRLAALPAIPWDQVEIFFSDERAVPPDSPRSNYGNAREALLDHVPIAASRIHRMEGERDDLSTVAREYEAMLPGSLDLLMLGIGTDGHTASLFPYAPALTEQERLVLPVVGGEPLIQRLTITPPVIARAGRVLVLASGADKAEAVAQALQGPAAAEAVPARLAREGTWILDRPAARLLV